MTSRHRVIALRDGRRHEVLAKTLEPHESVVLSAQIVEELKEVKLTLLLLFYRRSWEKLSSSMDSLIDGSQNLFTDEIGGCGV